MPEVASRLALHHHWRVVQKKLRRTLLYLSLGTRLAGRKSRLEALRRYLGREDWLKLQKADKVVVSLGKSGRTWLRVMISRLYQQTLQIPEHQVINFDNFHRMDRRAPRVFFTHDDYLGFWTGERQTKADYQGKELVLLVRDPRDVAVSQYFHWRYRMKPRNMALLDYPPPGEAIAMFDFLMDPNRGRLPRVIEALNLWAAAMRERKDLCLVRYEDLHADPIEALGRVAGTLGLAVSEEQIEEAVNYARYDNMKQMEAKQTLSGGRIKPVSKDDPNTYKVRKAKVGGYRDYFNAEQIARIDQLLRERLDPVFDYS